MLSYVLTATRETPKMWLVLISGVFLYGRMLAPPPLGARPLRRSSALSLHRFGLLKGLALASELTGGTSSEL